MVISKILQLLTPLLMLIGLLFAVKGRLRGTHKSNYQTKLEEAISTPNTINVTDSVIFDKNDVLVQKYIKASFRECEGLITRGSVILPYSFSENLAKKKTLGAEFEADREQFNESYDVDLCFYDDFNFEENHMPVYFADSIYIPNFKKHKYKVEEAYGRTIFDLLNSIPENSVVFISVKDDGSQALTPEICSELTNYGISKISRDHLRWGYINVILKDSGVFRSLLEIVDDELIEVSFNKNESLEGVKLPVNIGMKSGGFYKGNIASIIIDGIELSKKSRGMNIVVYSINGNKVLGSYSIDTFATIYDSDTVYLAYRE